MSMLLPRQVRVAPQPTQEHRREDRSRVKRRGKPLRMPPPDVAFTFFVVPFLFLIALLYTGFISLSRWWTSFLRE
jgi:hypothetical protein